MSWTNEHMRTFMMWLLSGELPVLRASALARNPYYDSLVKCMIQESVDREGTDVVIIALRRTNKAAAALFDKHRLKLYALLGRIVWDSYPSVGWNSYQDYVSFRFGNGRVYSHVGYHAAGVQRVITSFAVCEPCIFQRSRISQWENEPGDLVPPYNEGDHINPLTLIVGDISRPRQDLLPSPAPVDATGLRWLACECDSVDWWRCPRHSGRRAD